MSGTSVALFGGIPAGPEVLVILLIVILLFGANKIPKLARSTGEAMGEFQKGREEVEEELKEMRDGEGEAETDATATETSTEETSTSSE
jgi:sec-independent protein translocase protein TatA